MFHTQCCSSVNARVIKDLTSCHFCSACDGLSGVMGLVCPVMPAEWNQGSPLCFGCQL